MSPAAPLADAIRSLPPAYAAVLDGALDPALADRLRAAGLTALPLYLEGGDAVVWSGPMLVDLPTPAALEVALALPVGLAGVFWSWPGGVNSLRRHLRSINLVEVPAAAIEPGAAGLETVVFRHWDPEVLGPLLSVLTPDQQARLLGDAGGLAFEAREHQGLVAAARPPGLPPRPRGLLRFADEQVAALSRARVRASRRRIAAYLRETAPDHTARLDDTALLARVTQCEGEAQALGLQSERDIARWAFLQVMTGGALVAGDALRDSFDQRYTGRTPSEMLEFIFEDVERRLRRGI